MGKQIGTRRPLPFALVLSLAIVGCGDEEPKENGCRPEQVSDCDDGLVCEPVVGVDRFSCVAPVIVSGRVVGALDGAGIVGATVVGLDVNGAARTRVARSGANGAYELPVSIARNADGSPTAESITLRVAAADHQPFAIAPRSALPIALESGQLTPGQAYRIVNAATDVALLPLPPSARGGATLEGKVSASDPAGFLVLAVAGTAASSSAVSDRDGAFVLFNVPVGAMRLEGYRAGKVIEPKTVEVPASGLSGLTLSQSSALPAAVSGSISIVNAPGGLSTSVILVVASTFDPKAVRGEAPAGLRKQNVSGAFTIEGVPPGRYAVLAAFENDQLVRDPDASIAGTDVVFVDVGATGAAVSLGQTFKVTEALAITSPGAQGVDTVRAERLDLKWADDSSEDGYVLRVYDALGTMVHENMQIPRVTGGSVTYALDASGYTAGMLYQFRVWSFRDAQQGRTYISASEDLRGVFQITR